MGPPFGSPLGGTRGTAWRMLTVRWPEVQGYLSRRRTLKSFVLAADSVLERAVAPASQLYPTWLAYLLGQGAQSLQSWELLEHPSLGGIHVCFLLWPSSVQEGDEEGGSGDARPCAPSFSQGPQERPSAHYGPLSPALPFLDTPSAVTAELDSQAGIPALKLLSCVTTCRPHPSRFPKLCLFLGAARRRGQGAVQ